MAAALSRLRCSRATGAVVLSGHRHATCCTMAPVVVVAGCGRCKNLRRGAAVVQARRANTSSGRIGTRQLEEEEEKEEEEERGGVEETIQLEWEALRPLPSSWSWIRKTRGRQGCACNAWPGLHRICLMPLGCTESASCPSVAPNLPHAPRLHRICLMPCASCHVLGQQLMPNRRVGRFCLVVVRCIEYLESKRVGLEVLQQWSPVQVSPGGGAGVRGGGGGGGEV
jgi:hypothetical protein